MMGKVIDLKPNKYWQVKAADNSPETGELIIYGGIYSEKLFEDDITPKTIRDELKELGDLKNINVYINSPGGNAFAGNAIYNILKQHPAEITVYIEGLAASAASVIAMAGDKVVIPQNGLIMVHRAWLLALGNAEDLRKEAEILDRVDMSLVTAYQDKTGLEPGKILELMKEETWMDAEQAVELGFADETTEPAEVAACADPEVIKAFKNPPEQLQQVAEKGGCGPDEMKERELIAAGARDLNKQVRITLGR